MSNQFDVIDESPKLRQFLMKVIQKSRGITPRLNLAIYTADALVHPSSWETRQQAIEEAVRRAVAILETRVTAPWLSADCFTVQERGRNEVMVRVTVFYERAPSRGGPE